MAKANNKPEAPLKDASQDSTQSEDQTLQNQAEAEAAAKAEAEAAAKAEAEAAAKAEAEAAATKVDAAEGEVFVTVTVPKAFILRIDNHGVVNYKAGVQEMPLSHADHWYSKANGVEVYAPRKPE